VVKWNELNFRDVKFIEMKFASLEYIPVALDTNYKNR